jgi:hypothetical protein
MSELQTTAPEASARLVKRDRDMVKPGAQLVRAWPYIDVASAKGLAVTSESATSVTDPKADNVAHTGTFAKSRVWLDEGDPKDSDRAVTLFEELTLVTSVANFAAMSALSYRVISEWEETHPAVTSGTDPQLLDSTKTASDRRDKTYRYEFLNTASRSTIEAFTPANWQSLAPSNHVFYRLNIKEEDDKTLTVDAIFRYESKNRVVDSYTARVTKRQSVAERRKYDDADDTPITAAPEASTGVSKEESVSRNGDGTFDKAERISTAVAQQLFSIGLITVETTVDATVKEAGAYNATGPLTTPAASAGVVEQTQHQRNPDDTYDYRRRQTTSNEHALAQFTAKHSQTQQVQLDVSFNDRDAPTNVSQAAAGVETEKSATKNKDGTYDVTTRVATAVEQKPLGASGEVIDTDWDRRIKENRVRNAITLTGDYAVLTDEKPVAGTIIKVEKDRNPDGTYDVSRKTITTIENNVASHTAVKDKRYSASKTIYKNAVDQPTLTETYGRLDIKKNEAGRWDGEKLVISYVEDGDPTAWPSGSGTLYRIEKRRDRYADDGYAWRKVAYAYTVTYHATEGAAFSALSGGFTGSHVEAVVAKTLWRAYKVTSIVGGDWSYGALSAS